MRRIICLTFLAFTSTILLAQDHGQEYRVYTEHPRLFLRSQKLRLLKRERERESMRWKQLDALISGGAEMPEPGFAYALYYQVTGSAEAGKRAVTWALGPGWDLRQLAIVFDWCQDLLSEAQAKELAGKLLKGLTPLPAGAPIPAARGQALAAIAVAEQDQTAAELALRDLSENWWHGGLSVRLNAGENLDPGSDVQALFEMLHAIRDNLTIDLRADSPAYFKNLPGYQILCNYPAPFPAAENEYRIPFYESSGEPDLKRAALSRAANLSIVAYDNNALENQYLQGWLIQDRFILRSPFGAPYEFLWANPYQPGLSYAQLPLLFHDERSGSLFLRSSWDEDATWFSLVGGRAQLFQDGRISVLSQSGPLAAKPEPILIGNAAVVLARPEFKCKVDAAELFVIGAKPHRKYDVEIDDEELAEYEADSAGTLDLLLHAEGSTGIRMKEVRLGSP